MQVAAVIYVRVSSEEQTRNMSLETQQKRAADYAERQGWSVSRVFVERGESAKTWQRPEFKALIDYCQVNRGRVHFVIVDSLSRFARNTGDHHTVRALLAKYGVMLRSVSEPIDDSSSGRFMESVLAAYAQFDNDLRADRTKSGMETGMRKGRWMHKPPLGYLFQGTRDTARLAPDPARAHFIREAFELFASSGLTAKEVRNLLTRKGFRTNKGKPVSPQTFSTLLRNAIYAGWIVNKGWGIHERGDFSPLVEQSTFDAVQARLSGSTPKHARSRAHNAFPLKGTVKCGMCGGSLTASKSRGRNGQRYPFYRCWRRWCAGVNVRAEVLDGLFLERLAALQPKAEYIELFREVVLDESRTMSHAVSNAMAANAARTRALEEKKRRFVELLADDRIKQDAYELSVKAIDDDLMMASAERHELKHDEIDLEASLEFAEMLLRNVASLWNTSDDTQKQLLQRVVFPNGIPFANGELGNAVTSRLFSYFQTFSDTQSNLASPTGFEPVFSL